MIQSEQIEPAFACLLGEHYRMYKNAKNEHEKEETLKGLWDCMVNIYRLVTGITSSEFSERGTLAHAHVATDNNLIKVAQFITHEIGYDPMRTYDGGLKKGWTDWRTL